MSHLKDITEDTYAKYGFNRQELTDFFYSKGKFVNFGLPPMNFELTEDAVEDISLNDALEEIERLKARVAELEACTPSFLGKYMEDDPLLLAIRIRNDEWSNYKPDDRKSAPTQVYMQEKIKEILRLEFGLDINTAAIAKAIERVACPIER